jgi:hypothetical protein
VPDVGLGDIRAAPDFGHIAEPHRPASGKADHQLSDLDAAGEKATGHHCNGALRPDTLTELLHHIGRTQGASEFRHGHPVIGEPGWVQGDHHPLLGRADAVDIPRASHTLEFCFEAACHTRQICRATPGIICPQRDAHDGHIVDAARLDQRLSDATAPQQIQIRPHLIVETHQRCLAWHAHLELHRQHGNARPGYRVDVLDALDLR